MTPASEADPEEHEEPEEQAGAPGPEPATRLATSQLRRLRRIVRDEPFDLVHRHSIEVTRDGLLERARGDREAQRLRRRQPGA